MYDFVHLFLSLVYWLFKASPDSFKKSTSTPFLKLSFSVCAPITSDKCFISFDASQAARNTEQVNITKNRVHGRIRTLTRHGLHVTSLPSLPHGHYAIDMNEGIKCHLMYIYTIYK